ncbi:terminase gpA endonuclease subunit [Gimesia maris]|uniref:terminase gpA endonuclease subunit n=1 Tax=Gimesia maris TaxID=122 RepID=UPI0032F067C8
MTMTAAKSNQRFLANLYRELKPRRLRTFYEWCQEELVIPDGPYKGMRFNSDRQPYTKLIMQEVGKWRRHVFTGPTQSGKSLTAFVAIIMWHLFERGENVICGVPVGDMVKNKWLNDIRPAIMASRYRSLLPKKGAGSQGGTPTEIHFLNGATLIFMTGGGGDKGRAGATAPVVVITETDGMDEIGGTSREADKITQLEVRTNAYQATGLDRIYMECTVSLDEGRTWQEYINSTASRIMCQCPHCGVWQCPGRENLVGWQGAESKMEAGRLAKFACTEPDCGECWSDEERLSMNMSAKLVHAGQEITPDGTVTGTPVDTDTFGGRWDAWNNMFTSPQRIGEMEWEAEQSEDAEALQLKMKQFIWALPAEDLNTEKVPISVGIVRGSDKRYQGRCSGIKRGEVPHGSHPLTCFIDISMRVLQWSIEVKVDKRIHVVDYGFHETPHPEVIGDEAAIEAGLHELCPMIYEKYPLISLGLIDCGNWREKILNIVPALDGPWMPSHGLSNYKHPENNNSKVQTAKVKIPIDGNRHYHTSKDGAIWVVNFDPDALKHRVHSGFLIKPETEYGFAPGCITLPGNDPLEHTEYAKQVAAEEFRSVFKEGKGVKKEWFKTRRHNHMLDGCVGNMVARMVVATHELTKRNARPRIYGVISKQ